MPSLVDGPQTVAAYSTCGRTLVDVRVSCSWLLLCPMGMLRGSSVERRLSGWLFLSPCQYGYSRIEFCDSKVLGFCCLLEYLSVYHVCRLDNLHLIDDSYVFTLVWVESHLPVSIVGQLTQSVSPGF